MELKVSPNSVLSEITRVLREAIIKGHFKPGDRLIESELVQTLKVSRPSLREALRRLEAERLIDIVPNRGPIVPVMTWEYAEQIYHTRMLLEGEVAALAARYATRADIDDLRVRLKDFQDAASKNDAERQVSSTNEFYDVLMRAANNAVIMEILQGLNARISFLRAKSMSRVGRANASAAELAKILDAVAAGDDALARQMAVDHIAKACKAAAEVGAG